MVKKECNYVIQSFEFDTPTMKKTMNQTQMVKYAKKMLKLEHEMGLEKETKITDLSRPINAWVYLKNIGLGLKTNCKRWR